MHECGFGGQGAMKLEQILRNAVGQNAPLGLKLRVLSLKNNKIGNIGFEAICKSL